MMYMTVEYAWAAGMPALIWLSRKPLTRVGPAMAAALQASSSRPWMAPTLAVPNRSRR
ncbi:hypothetical protein DESA109040_16880 [Deinococcus saxicola]